MRTRLFAPRPHRERRFGISTDRPASGNYRGRAAFRLRPQCWVPHRCASASPPDRVRFWRVPNAAKRHRFRRSPQPTEGVGQRSCSPRPFRPEPPPNCGCASLPPKPKELRYRCAREPKSGVPAQAQRRQVPAHKDRRAHADTTERFPGLRSGAPKAPRKIQTLHFYAGPEPRAGRQPAGRPRAGRRQSRTHPGKRCRGLRRTAKIGFQYGQYGRASLPERPGLVSVQAGMIELKWIP